MLRSSKHSAKAFCLFLLLYFDLLSLSSLDVVILVWFGENV